MTTRAEFRRRLGLALQDHCFRMFGSAAMTASSSGTTTTLVDTARLKQANNYWTGQWVYFPATGELREISGSTQSSGTITWLVPLAGATGATTIYEIWAKFTPYEVNDAINAALESSWPWFFAVTTYKLVVQSGCGTEYSLSGLSPTPRWIAQVYFESLSDSVVGQVTTVVAQNRLKDTGHTFTSADVGKEIRIYEGTSVGDVRTISSLVDSNTVEVSANFTAILSTTSKYRMVDVTVENHGFTLDHGWYVDSPTNPTALTLSVHPYGWEGYIYKVVYEALHTGLTTETAAIPVPEDWLLQMVLSKLYQFRIATSPAAENKNWPDMFQTATAMAKAIATSKAQRHLAATMTDRAGAAGRLPPEYPF